MRHKQHIFAGKELKFLFQPAFSGDYIGRVASECSCRSSRRSFHSVHCRFHSVSAEFHSRVNPLCFSSLATAVHLFSLPFLSRFAICDFWHASYSWVGRVKPDPWEASTQNIKFNLTNSINPTNEVGTQNVSLTFVTHIRAFAFFFLCFFPLFFCFILGNHWTIHRIVKHSRPSTFVSGCITVRSFLQFPNAIFEINSLENIILEYGLERVLDKQNARRSLDRELE